ncbi:hypothetical protein BG003_010370 [Podila horticola]|nr:hypothetical protein BG003_010370 [Podila horticola]
MAKTEAVPELVEALVEGLLTEIGVDPVGSDSAVDPVLVEEFVEELVQELVEELVEELGNVDFEISGVETTPDRPEEASATLVAMGNVESVRPNTVADREFAEFAEELDLEGDQRVKLSSD